MLITLDGLKAVGKEIAELFADNRKPDEVITNLSNGVNIRRIKLVNKTTPSYFVYFDDVEIMEVTEKVIVDNNKGGLENLLLALKLLDGCKPHMSNQITSMVKDTLDKLQPFHSFNIGDDININLYNANLGKARTIIDYVDITYNNKLFYSAPMNHKYWQSLKDALYYIFEDRTCNGKTVAYVPEK
jgi:hypothetical protein